MDFKRLSSIHIFILALSVFILISMIARSYIASEHMANDANEKFKSEMVEMMQKNDAKDQATMDLLHLLERKVSLLETELNAEKEKHLTVKEKPTTCKQRFVFIDLGANKGDSFETFIEDPNAAFKYSFPKPEGCSRKDAEVFLFEANPDFNPSLIETRQKALYHRDANGQLDPLVKSIDLYPSTLAYTVETVKDFYRDKNNPAGNSVRNMTYLNEKIAIQLSAVDIAKFIIKNFLPDDFVVVKMDIEGAEYEILPHFVDMSAYLNIDYLYLEWHDWGEQNQEAIAKGKEMAKILIEKGVKMPSYVSPF